MKAVTYYKYGSPDNLILQEIDKPIPKDNEILIKVHTASINSWDNDLVLGKPLISRLGGLLRPKHNILGIDVAGTVEVAGKDVTDIKPGDEVFGDMSGCNFGAFAEYVCADASVMAVKPKEITFEEAASLPHAGVLALQALKQCNIIDGQKILINGAGGGAGTIALQIAKTYNTEITCIDNEKKLNQLKNFGAKFTIDYTKENFTKSGKQYNAIIDNVARHSFFNYKKSLKEKGSFVMVGGSTGLILITLILGKLLKPFIKKEMGLLLHKPNRTDLDILSKMMLDGKLKPVIDSIYPLKKTKEAFKHFGTSDFFGKIIIKVI